MNEVNDQSQEWEMLWGIPVPENISRPMFEKSLEFKRLEKAGAGLNPKQQAEVEKLVRGFLRSPEAIDRSGILKLGTRLVKMWKGKRYVVEVTPSGFMHEEVLYSSLSDVASTITGTRWNGWAFFGLKKKASCGGKEK